MDEVQLIREHLLDRWVIALTTPNLPKDGIPEVLDAALATVAEGEVEGSLSPGQGHEWRTIFRGLAQGIAGVSGAALTPGELGIVESIAARAPVRAHEAPSRGFPRLVAYERFLTFLVCRDQRPSFEGITLGDIRGRDDRANSYVCVGLRHVVTVDACRAVELSMRPSLADGAQSFGLRWPGGSAALRLI